MKRSFLLQTALLATVLMWGNGLRGEDAPVQREDIGRALEMYRWLIDHEEFSAAGKLAAEIQAMHPDDPQVQLIVENAQLRAAVREANRVLVDDESSPIGFTVPAAEPQVLQASGADLPASSEPFSGIIDWRELSRFGASAPVPPAQAIEPGNARNAGNLIEVPPGLFSSMVYGYGYSETTAEDLIQSTISLHFNDAPVSEIMRHVSEVCGLNIVIDEVGLQEEGVSSDTPITINVDGIQAKSALHLMLRPLNLDYVFEDEVIQVTSRTRSRTRQLGDFSTRVYAVPDLVMPIPHRTPGSVQDRVAQVTEAPTGEFEWLIDLITSTIHPDTWQESGGQGFVAPHEGTLSLVIRQQSVVHEGIGDLLMQVRRLHDVQVSHTMHLLSVPVSELHELGLSEEQEVRIVSVDEKAYYETEFFGAESQFDVQALPGVTLFNRQTGTVVDSERTLLISSVASPDNRTIRLNVAAPMTLELGDVMSAVHSAEVPDGAVALILVSDGTRLLSEESQVDVLAITPRIQIHEEEEELLGLPVY